MMHDTYLWNSRHKHATAKLNEIAEWYDILLVYLGSLELDQVFQEQSDWDHRWIITTRIIKKKKIVYCIYPHMQLSLDLIWIDIALNGKFLYIIGD